MQLKKEKRKAETKPAGSGILRLGLRTIKADGLLPRGLHSGELQGEQVLIQEPWKSRDGHHRNQGQFPWTESSKGLSQSMAIMIAGVIHTVFRDAALMHTTQDIYTSSVMDRTCHAHYTLHKTCYMLCPACEASLLNPLAGQQARPSPPWELRGKLIPTYLGC